MISHLRRILRRIAIAGVRLMQKLVDHAIQDGDVHLWAPKLTSEITHGIRRRLEFYVPGQTLVAHSRLPLRVALSSRPVLTFGEIVPAPGKYMEYRDSLFDVDHERNYDAGWQWCKLAEYCAREKVDIADSHRRFRIYVDALRKESFEKVYVFGTGPSLPQADRMDWSDGFRIVCNTIVRDGDLWKHIDPHFIVAGDAIYHFSYAKFARQFRMDLARRLSETNTVFVYPACYHQIVARELSQFADRLIPVPPSAEGHKHIYVDLVQEFGLPSMGNVLPMLLLPLACTLSKQILLWGFDGRAPHDRLFWANSPKHTYPEYLAELRDEFPAFFDHFVPENNPQQYVEEVHGDVLEQSLQEAERAGWSVVMLHRSWTAALQKRRQILIGRRG